MFQSEGGRHVSSPKARQLRRHVADATCGVEKVFCFHTTIEYCLFVLCIATISSSLIFSLILFWFSSPTHTHTRSYTAIYTDGGYFNPFRQTEISSLYGTIVHFSSTVIFVPGNFLSILPFIHRSNRLFRAAFEQVYTLPILVFSTVCLMQSESHGIKQHQTNNEFCVRLFVWWR